MISVTASAISLAAAAWPIASPSPKLCTPMPIAIRNESRIAGFVRSSRAPLGELVDRRRARPDERRRAPVGAGLHPRVVVDEAHQSGDEAGVPSTRSSANVPQSCAFSDASIGSTAFVITSQKRKTRIPGRERREPGARVRAETPHARRSAGRGRSSRRRSRRTGGFAVSSCPLPDRTCKGIPYTRGLRAI